MSEIILQTQGVSRNFGGLVAVDSVDLDVEKASITAIIGPNGAGKTTLFNLITGVYPVSKGQIIFNDLPVHRYSPTRRCSLGIVRTFQHVHLFPHMSALENVMVGQHSRSSYGFLESAFRLPKSHREEGRIARSAMKYLNMVGLGQQAGQDALSLPLGQQKLLAIARALGTEPKLLLLDEPGAGLNRLEKKDLSDLIRRIRELGITVILVEHDMPLVMGLAEKVVVIDAGKKIAEGTASQVQKDRRVIAAYLGDDEEDF